MDKDRNLIQEKKLQLKAQCLAQSKDWWRNTIMEELKYPYAGEFFRTLEYLGVLEHIIPDLHKGVGCMQNKHHADDVFEHLCHCVDKAVGKKYTPLMKLAILFHDIAKPHTKELRKGDATFYKHEIVGATIAYNWMKEYGFPQEDIDYVVKMVRHHQWRFTDDTKDKTYRRWLQEVGKDHWRDLVRIRIADRKGNRAKAGRPAITSKMKELIRKIRSIINEKQVVFKEDLAISGEDLKALGITPGPVYKQILTELAGIVLNTPSHNNKEWLLQYVRDHHVSSSK